MKQPHAVWLSHSLALIGLALVITGCGAQSAAQPGQATNQTARSPTSVAISAPAANATPAPTADGPALRPTLVATEAAAAPAPSPPPGGAEGVVPAELMERIKADLADRSGVAVEAIVELSAEAVEWSDSSLGCPRPDMSYMQVITPGYRVMLQAGDTVYDYHASQNDFLLCPATS